jgi:hypothetical protein
MRSAEDDTPWVLGTPFLCMPMQWSVQWADGRALVVGANRGLSHLRHHILYTHRHPHEAHALHVGTNHHAHGHCRVVRAAGARGGDKVQVRLPPPNPQPPCSGSCRREDCSMRACWRSRAHAEGWCAQCMPQWVPIKSAQLFCLLAPSQLWTRVRSTQVAHLEGIGRRWRGEVTFPCSLGCRPPQTRGAAALLYLGRLLLAGNQATSTALLVRLRRPGGRGCKVAGCKVQAEVGSTSRRGCLCCPAICWGPDPPGPFTAAARLPSTRLPSNGAAFVCARQPKYTFQPGSHCSWSGAKLSCWAGAKLSCCNLLQECCEMGRRCCCGFENRSRRASRSTSTAYVACHGRVRMPRRGGWPWGLVLCLPPKKLCPSQHHCAPCLQAGT